MVQLSLIRWVAWILVVIGAINWGLVGLFRVDLIAVFVGDMSLLARLVYILVGVAGGWMIYDRFRTPPVI